jgi:hypothetical protein
MKTDLKATAKRFAGATELFARRNGPVILTGCGVAGFLVTNILVARAALKAQEPVKDLRLKFQRVPDMTPAERKAIREDIGRDVVAVAKIYAPAVAMGSVSVFCLIASHGMMRSRQAALLAAYSAMQQGYEAYRERVRRELGEDKEREIYRDVRVTGDPDDPALPCEIDYDDRMPSPYARFFDQLSPNFEKTPEYNLLFVHQQQQWANDRLNAYGHIFLNEVYDALGIPRSQAGQIVGWQLGHKNSDGFITFGVYDIFDDNARAFVNGVEGTILLDFNVDGPIAI